MVAAAIGGSAVLGLAGASMQSDAAKSAADTQAAAAENASNLQFQMFQQMQGNLAPYMALGTNNIPGLQAQQQKLQGMSFNNPIPNPQDVQNTPGYQFTLQQGTQNTNNALAAKGLNMSGAQARGLAQYTTGLADQTYNQQFQNSMQQYNAALQQFNTNYGVQSDAYNRLSGMVALGQNAAAGVGNAGLQTANTAGNYLTQGANAQAAGIIGSANAVNSGLQGLGNNAFMYSLLGNSGGAATAANTGSLYSLMNIGPNNAVL